MQGRGFYPRLFSFTGGAGREMVREYLETRGATSQLNANPGKKSIVEGALAGAPLLPAFLPAAVLGPEAFDLSSLGGSASAAGWVCGVAIR